MRFRLMITLASVLILSVAACELIFKVCESILILGLKVELTDAVSGEPVIVDSIFATATTSGYADTVTRVGGRNRFHLVEDRPGTYTVNIDVPGYAYWQRVNIEVEMEDRCHVKTQALPVSLYQLTP